MKAVKKEYTGVMTFAQQAEGAVSPVSLELIGKARSGLSDHEFRAELAAVLARLPEMDLTNDDLLQEALWDASAEAYRKGWEINWIEDEI